ncbi:MAG: ATP-binding cassette domain-containing protein [Collinsella aerofaciens]
MIGPNGVGKTTLFKTIVGLEPLASGNLESVRPSRSPTSMNARVSARQDPVEVVSDGLDIMQVAETEVPSRAYVASFGFKGPDQQKRAGVLSGGERNRLNLALTLKQGGNLLLLDEPTNDLDVETLSALESALLEFPGCSVVISHDRMFLDRVATHILAWRVPTRTPATGIGSRATSSRSRTASPAWVRTPPSRIASTASSRAISQSAGAHWVPCMSAPASDEFGCGALLRGWARLDEDALEKSRLFDGGQLPLEVGAPALLEGDADRLD